MPSHDGARMASLFQIVGSPPMPRCLIIHFDGGDSFSGLGLRRGVWMPRRYVRHDIGARNAVVAVAAMMPPRRVTAEI